MTQAEHPSLTALAEREIVTVRIFQAPRERVFAAWLDPDQLAQWWGPAGFTNSFHEFEPEEGGVWRFTMYGPNGAAFPNESRFLEIDRPKRIVLDHLSRPHFRVTATFEAEDDATRLIFCMRFATVADCETIRPLAMEGNQQTFDRLAALLDEA